MEARSNDEHNGGSIKNDLCVSMNSRWAVCGAHRCKGGWGGGVRWTAKPDAWWVNMSSLQWYTCIKWHPEILHFIHLELILFWKGKARSLRLAQQFREFASLPEDLSLAPKLIAVISQLPLIIASRVSYTFFWPTWTHKECTHVHVQTHTHTHTHTPHTQLPPRQAHDWQADLTKEWVFFSWLLFIPSQCKTGYKNWGRWDWSKGSVVKSTCSCLGPPKRTWWLTDRHL